MNSETENAFVIRSTKSDTMLIISDIRSEEFLVSFDSADVSAKKVVCSYTQPYGIPDLLQTLASYERAWPESIALESLERDFIISAECSSLGSVIFSIKIRRYSEDEDWKVEAEILTEMGQLPLLARTARKVFDLAYS